MDSTKYSKIGEDLRKAVGQFGTDFLRDTEKVTEYLNSRHCDATAVYQFGLFLHSGNLTRYIPQIKSGIGMVDVNNIYVNSCQATGLNTDVVRQLLLAGLYALSLPTQLGSVYDPSLPLKGASLEALYQEEGAAEKLGAIREAVAARDEKAVKELLTPLNRMAGAGYTEAIFLRGQCLMTGLGVERNEVEGLKDLEQACANGYVPAYAAMGDYYFSEPIRKNYTKALQYYTMMGAVAHTKERQNNIRVAMEQKATNKKLWIANVILSVLLVLCNVLLMSGVLSGGGKVKIGWSVVSVVFSLLGLAPAVLSKLRTPYNSIRAAIPFTFFTAGLCLFFSLL